MSGNTDTLRIQIFGRAGQELASLGREDRDVKTEIMPGVNATVGTELRRYVDVIEATLREGEGTYTGTIAQAQL